jgi:glycosyltransferase involved in cell wall biosynthesis
MKMAEVALILPTFNEEHSLHQLLTKILYENGNKIFYVIVDDSPNGISSKTAKGVFRELNLSDTNYHIISRNSKKGRGNAVYTGFEFAFKNSNFKTFIEMDSDGSHQTEDLLKIINSAQNYSLVIGSRYLSNSKISGWPIRRRIFSRALNFIIPKLFNLQISDCTNGLRGYDRNALSILLNHEPQNDGFIYLTESLLVLNGKVSIHEVPTTFINRTLGSSTVTSKELIDSIKGIVNMIVQSRCEP